MSWSSGHLSSCTTLLILQEYHADDPKLFMTFPSWISPDIVIGNLLFKQSQSAPQLWN